MDNIKPSEISQVLLEQLKDIDTSLRFEEIGKVLQVSDGVARMYGLTNAEAGELLEFESGVMGVVMNLEQDNVGAVLLGPTDEVKEGMTVRRTGRIASIKVGEQMLGRVVDPLGVPLDGLGKVEGDLTEMPLERKAPGVIFRQPVTEPLQTGIMAIDSMIPIGRGQRELIIGDRQTGKTAIAIDAILAQKGQNVLCIYVAIGQKRATVAEIAARLEAAGAMEYTTIVCATASDSASLQYIAPFAGAAMSEYFMYKGRDVLIVYDDLSKHAVAYREISLLLHRPSGREAYPGDIFYLHSRLLERAARINAEAGGGSVTALPVIETQAGDISAYIPTNVISITDGQIFLETELFHSGVMPAVNPGISVSRVGGSAQIKAMKKVAGKLKLLYSQYRELQSFAQFGSDLDKDTRDRLEQGARIVEVLKQNRNAPVDVAYQVCILYAVIGGYLKDIPVERIRAFEAELYPWMEANAADVLTAIRETKDLSKETEALLNKAITTRVAEFLQNQ